MTDAACTGLSAHVHQTISPYRATFIGNVGKFFTKDLGIDNDVRANRREVTGVSHKVTNLEGAVAQERQERRQELAEQSTRLSNVKDKVQLQGNTQAEHRRRLDQQETRQARHERRLEQKERIQAEMNRKLERRIQEMEQKLAQMTTKLEEADKKPKVIIQNLQCTVYKGNVTFEGNQRMPFPQLPPYAEEEVREMVLNLEEEEENSDGYDRRIQHY